MRHLQPKAGQKRRPVDHVRHSALSTPEYANEGSADAFATLLEGYSVTEGLRRRFPLLNKLSREDIFTAPAVFQLLPHRSSTRFLDENLEPLEVDL